MYSPIIIEKTLDQFEAENGWRPVRHTLGQVEDFNGYIDSLMNVERGDSRTWYEIKAGTRINSTRRAEIRRWIDNEQFLCNPPEAPIWMADLTFKPIGEIKPGDEVIGWEREVSTSKRNHSGRASDRIAVSEVLSVMRRISPIVKVTLESGTVLRCTPDHKWSNGNTGGRKECPWITAKKGRTLRKLVDVYKNEPPDDRVAGWLGGIYDGEGNKRNIYQSQSANPEVYDEIGVALRKLGFDSTAWIANTRKTAGHFFKGGWNEAARFLAWCRPVKSKSLLKEIFSSHVRSDSDRVVSVEHDGWGEVVSMQTSTGNYVAWGYMSKNCFADANYWKTRYGWLCNEKNDVLRYVPRKSQEVFQKILEPFDELQVAIELFVIKSRQVGVSTEVALDFLQRILFIPNTQAVMASVKGTQSDLLARMLEVCWERQPFWLIPGRTSTKAAMPQWSNGSILSIQSGSQAMGIAQGWTPSLIHISELADIPRPKKVLEEGLFPATHSTYKLFFVMEGTGGDSTSWQADKWKYYKANWGKGGRFMPTFIPWPCASDIYPPADWLKKQPIPEMWEPRDETKRMRRKAELFIQSTDYLSRVMGANWTMPREQQWFWETKYNEALASHTVKVFLSQFPVSDDEALQSKNDLVFSDEVIADIQTRSEKEYQAYAITGQSVLIGQNDEPYEPDSSEIDYELPRVPVSWESKNGQMNYWELVPLKPFDATDDNMCFNRLLVFKQPQEGEDYAIGIDTADGLGNQDEDRAVAEVVLNRAGNQRDEQVAEFVSNIVNPPQMVSIAACLAAWYGQWREGRPYTKDPRGVKFCIEQRMRAGDDCQFQLKLMGFNYHHLFIAYDGKDVNNQSASKMGWFSNVWSRPMLLNRFQDAVQGGWIKINSPMSLKQLSTWVRKISASGKSKLDHESGHHDDNIVGLAQGYFTRHSHDVLVNRQTLKYQSNDQKLTLVSYEWIENRVQV